MKVRTMLVAGLFLAACSLSIAGDHEDFAENKGATLYLQHNLFHDGDDARWINYPDDQFLPAGTAVLIKKVKDDEVVFTLVEGGDKFALDLDDAEPSYSEMTDRIFGTEPPSMDDLSEVDLEGIEGAAIQEGMSRRAVFMAVGYPPHFHQKPFTDTKIENEDLTADTLTFMEGSWDMKIVDFEDDIVTYIDD